MPTLQDAIQPRYMTYQRPPRGETTASLFAIPYHFYRTLHSLQLLVVSAFSLDRKALCERLVVFHRADQDSAIVITIAQV